MLYIDPERSGLLSNYLVFRIMKLPNSATKNHKMLSLLKSMLYIDPERSGLLSNYLVFRIMKLPNSATKNHKANSLKLKSSSP